MNLPWHADIKQEILRLHGAGALPHALMLSGGKGLGAEVLAQDLAALLLCDAPMGDQACGQCKSCTLLEAGSHNDYKQLSPEEEGKQIKVDAVRALVEFVFGSSLRDGYKIAVIDPVEGLNTNGANALLKTLEEPAGNTILLLVTERPDAVLPTIRSRCQLFALNKPSKELGMQWLAEVLPSESPDLLSRYLDIAHGEPLRAKHYIELNAWQEQLSMLSGLSLVLKRQQTVSKLAGQWADDLLAQRLEWLVLWLEQMIRFVSTNDECVFVHDDGKAMLRYLAEKNEVEVLFALRQEMLEQLALLNGVTNPNAQLLCESVILSWNALM